MNRRAVTHSDIESVTKDDHATIGWLPTQGNSTQSPDENLFRMKFDSKLTETGRLIAQADKRMTTYDLLNICAIRMWRYRELRTLESFTQWFPNCDQGINGILVDESDGRYTVIDGKIRVQVLKEIAGFTTVSSATADDFDYSPHISWLTAYGRSVDMGCTVIICPVSLSESDKKLLPLVTMRLNATNCGCNVIEAIKLIRDVGDQFGVQVAVNRPQKRIASRAHFLIQHTMYSLGFPIDFILNAMDGLKSLVKLTRGAFNTFERVLAMMIEREDLKFSNDTDVDLYEELGITTNDCPYNVLADNRKLLGTDSTIEFWNEVPKLFLKMCSDKPMWSRMEKNIIDIFLRYGGWSFYHTLIECYILLILREKHTDKDGWYCYQKYYTYTVQALQNFENKRKSWPLICVLPSYFVVKQHRFHTNGSLRHEQLELPPIHEILRMLTEPDPTNVDTVDVTSSTVGIATPVPVSGIVTRPVIAVASPAATVKQQTKHTTDDIVNRTPNVATKRRWKRRTDQGLKVVGKTTELLMQSVLGSPSPVKKQTALVLQSDAAPVLQSVAAPVQVDAAPVQVDAAPVQVDGHRCLTNRVQTADALYTSVVLNYTSGSLLPSSMLKQSLEDAGRIVNEYGLDENSTSVSVIMPLDYIHHPDWTSVFRLNIRVTYESTFNSSPVFVALAVVTMQWLASQHNTRQDVDNVLSWPKPAQDVNRFHSLEARKEKRSEHVQYLDVGNAKLAGLLDALYKNTSFYGKDQDVLDFLYDGHNKD